MCKDKSNKLEDKGYSPIARTLLQQVQPFHCFLDALRSRSLGDFCGEVAGNFFFFLCNRLVGGVTVVAACLDETDLVLFCSSVSVAATPPEVPYFLLLGPFGLARISLLGVCCEEVGVGSSVAYPLAVIARLHRRRQGVITFSLPFRERTGI